MPYSEALTPVASLTANQLVGGWLPNDGAPGRLFRPAGTPANGSSAAYPSVVGTPVQVTQVDGSFGGTGSTVGGPYKVHLQPAATDTVNASSPIQLLVPPEAVFITATG